MDNNKKWWESEGGFFGDVYMEADDSLEGHLNNPSHLSERTETEVNGVIRLCNLKPGGAVLDCPCGYGRHSLGLAQKGMVVTGADINDQFLALDQDSLKKVSNVDCRFVKKDMRNLEYNNEFDAVINMFYSFGFFDSDDENASVAQEFYKALKTGGKFLMHTHVTVPRLVSGELKNHQVRQLKSGGQLQLERHYNNSTKREDGVWTVIEPDGKTKPLTPYSVRLYTASEFTELCTSVGFSKVDCYGDWDGSEYTDESPQLITVATK